MGDLSGSLRVLYPELRAHWLCSAQQTPGEGLVGCKHPEPPSSHAASGLSLEKEGVRSLEARMAPTRVGMHQGQAQRQKSVGKHSASISCLLPPRTLLPQQALRASLVAQW